MDHWIKSDTRRVFVDTPSLIPRSINISFETHPQFILTFPNMASTTLPIFPSALPPNIAVIHSHLKARAQVHWPVRTGMSGGRPTRPGHPLNKTTLSCTVKTTATDNFWFILRTNFTTRAHLTNFHFLTNPSVP